MVLGVTVFKRTKFVSPQNLCPHLARILEPLHLLKDLRLLSTLLSPSSMLMFLASLSARGPGKFLSKRMRSNWLDLYRRFLRGQNFMPWFQRRRAVAEEELGRLWRQSRIETDIRQFIPQMSELEMVDSFNAIERHLCEMQSGSTRVEDSAAAYQKLKGDLETVFSFLPEDIQQSLLLNPQRAALLQSTNEHTVETLVGVTSSSSDR